MKNMFFSVNMVCALTFCTAAMNNAEAQTTQKKWSNKKKYTAIGTGVGVGTGIAVGRNDSKSAVIGGVIGAGSGYYMDVIRTRKKESNSFSA